jgi:hypothetical protein
VRLTKAVKPRGSILVGTVVVNEGKVVRRSQAARFRSLPRQHGVDLA